jgi:hypothetical protein
VHAADSGEDSCLPGRDPGRGGEEEEGEADQVRSVSGTTIISADIETIDVDDEEGDV